MNKLFLNNINLQRFAEGQAEPGAENPETGTGEEQGEEETKTYTQEEVDEIKKGLLTQDQVNEIVEKRIAREKKKAEEEKEKAERLSKLSAEERAKEEARLKDEEIEKLKAEIQRNELEKDTIDRLNEEGLPLEFKSFLMLEDAESTNEAIKIFKPLYDAKVQAEVEKRFAGKTPSASTPPKSKDAFDRVNERYKK